MDILLFLISTGLLPGLIGLVVLFWSPKSNQYDDPEAADSSYTH